MKKKDCNIEKIQKLGKLAIRMAIRDYKNGCLRDNPATQIISALIDIQTAISLTDGKETSVCCKNT